MSSEKSCPLFESSLSLVKECFGSDFAEQLKQNISAILDKCLEKEVPNQKVGILKRVCIWLMFTWENKKSLFEIKISAKIKRLQM